MIAIQNTLVNIIAMAFPTYGPYELQKHLFGTRQLPDKLLINSSLCSRELQTEFTKFE